MKICIERTDRMGDMILTLPIIQGIKELNPQVEIHVIASKKISKYVIVLMVLIKFMNDQHQ